MEGQAARTVDFRLVVLSMVGVSGLGHYNGPLQVPTYALLSPLLLHGQPTWNVKGWYTTSRSTTGILIHHCVVVSILSDLAVVNLKTGTIHISFKVEASLCFFLSTFWCRMEHRLKVNRWWSTHTRTHSIFKELAASMNLKQPSMNFPIGRLYIYIACS